MFLHDSRNAILKAQQQGIQQGDRQARLKIAQQLLEVLDIKTIAQKTGLSLEEVQQLSQQLVQ
jgi:predicted transposase/invertase (TIGR01784 family)